MGDLLIDYSQRNLDNGYLHRKIALILTQTNYIQKGRPRRASQTDVGLNLGQLYSRWTNIKPTLVRCVLFTEAVHPRK